MTSTFEIWTDGSCSGNPGPGGWGAALIAGYQSIHPLNEAERAALPLLARGAAIRFFLTRLVDLYAAPADALVKPHDPLAFAARLRFHRKAMDAGDYGA